MAWYLNRALTNLRNEVNARWPGRDKTSDGTIGDAAHQNSTSDHNPDRDGSVDAWDMDVDGVDVWAVIDAFEKHPAARYWIYNRQIASRSNNWRRERYTGSNPHDKHVHFNTREEFEDSNRQWLPQEEDDDMDQKTFNTLLINALRAPSIGAEFRKLPWQYSGNPLPTGASTISVVNEVHSMVVALRGEVASMRQALTPEAVAAAVVASLPEDKDDITVEELTEAFRRLFVGNG